MGVLESDFGVNVVSFLSGDVGRDDLLREFFTDDGEFRGFGVSMSASLVSEVNVTFFCGLRPVFRSIMARYLGMPDVNGSHWNNRNSRETCRVSTKQRAEYSIPESSGRMKDRIARKYVTQPTRIKHKEFDSKETKGQSNLNLRTWVQGYQWCCWISQVLVGQQKTPRK